MDVSGDPSQFKVVRYVQPNKVLNQISTAEEFLNKQINSNVSNEIKMAIKRANTTGFSSVSFETRPNLTKFTLTRNQHGEDLQFNRVELLLHVS